MPTAAEIDYSTGANGSSYQHHRGAADIVPRLSHFDYIKNYGVAPSTVAAGPGSTAFKSLTYAAGMRGDEYAPHHAAPLGAHHAHVRRYLAPSLAAAAAHAAALLDVRRGAALVLARLGSSILGASPAATSTLQTRRRWKMY